MSTSFTRPSSEAEALSANEMEANESMDDGTATVLRHQTPGHLTDMHIAADFVEKLHNLKYTMQLDMTACDAKWTLFVAAALSYRYDTQLKPVPQRFMSEVAGCNIDALVSVINDTPKLRVLLQNIIDEEYEELNTEVVDLLHWVIVELRNPILRSLDGVEYNTEVLPVLANEPKELCKPTHVFEVCPSKDTLAEGAFRAAVEKNNTKIAFYGDKLDSFFSIIHQGFPQRQPYHKEDGPVNLCTDLATVSKRSPDGAGWGASACGAMISCIAICEYIDDPDAVQTRLESGVTHVEVAKSDFVRVRHLLFYGSHFAAESNLKNLVFDFISRHKCALSLACYTVVLTSIGVAHSSSGHYIKHFLSKKTTYFLNCFRKMLIPDT